jgi:hypothetical protein
MKSKILVLSFAALVAGGSAHANEVVKMTSPDSAVAKYEDDCSNGANITASGRRMFTKQMLKNPKSKLSKLKAELLKNTDPDMPDQFVLSEWVQTSHLRNGCSTSINAFTAFVQTISSDNVNHLVTHYIITIEDSEEAGDREFNVVSIKKIDL